jgi:hypothetical protein
MSPVPNDFFPVLGDQGAVRRLDPGTIHFGARADIPANSARMGAIAQIRPRGPPIGFR